MTLVYFAVLRLAGGFAVLRLAGGPPG